MHFHNRATSLAKLIERVKTDAKRPQDAYGKTSDSAPAAQLTESMIYALQRNCSVSCQELLALAARRSGTAPASTKPSG